MSGSARRPTSALTALLTPLGATRMLKCRNAIRRAALS